MEPRKISNKELADLSDEWENPRVDTRYYKQQCLNVWEIDEKTYLELKADGVCVQRERDWNNRIVPNGRFYAGY